MTQFSDSVARQGHFTVPDCFRCGVQLGKRKGVMTPHALAALNATIWDSPDRGGNVR